MATRAQLEAEPEWGREIVTPELRWLGDQLCARTGRPRSAAGDRGNIGHLYGAHRSQEWIKSSVWCQNRSYTVQPSLSATQARHIAGFDFTPAAWGSDANRRAVTLLTRRLVDAGLSRRLAGIHEVIGTLNGRNPVGVDVPEGQTWPADASHLDHVHLTFDRRRLADRAVMERVLAVALGEDEDMELGDRVPWVTDEQRDRMVKLLGPEDAKGLNYQQILTYSYEFSRRALDSTKVIADEVETLTELVRKGGGNPDLAGLITRVDALTASVSKMAEAVAVLNREQAEIRKRLATAFGTG